VTMSMLCNCCVRELLILARTWFAFGLPSKTGCDSELQKTWMPLKEVVGGIYILQPLPSHWMFLLSMGTPDSPVVHRTGHCSLSGACHVSMSLGFGVVDCWSPLSCSCTGQSGATPDMSCAL
jgi:hypothetical protein